MHPLTPLSRGLGVMGMILAFVFLKNLDSLLEIFEDGTLPISELRWVILIVAAIALGAAVVVGLFTFVAWRREEYAITDEAVWHRRGIIFRSQRHARLTRIQSVNITHGLVGRLFKLGSVTIEVAGGAGSNVVLGLLSSSNLESLRGEILSQANRARAVEKGELPAEGDPGAGAGTTPPVLAVGDESEPAGHPHPATLAGHPGVQAAHPGAQPPAAPAGHPHPATPAGHPGVQAAHPGAQPPAAPAGHPHPATPVGHLSRAASRVDALLATEADSGTQIFAVPTRQLLRSVLFNLGVMISSAIGLVVIAVGVAGLLLSSSWAGSLSFGAVFGFGTAAVAMLALPWKEFSQNYNFVANLTPEGIRLRAGLTSTRSQTIPVRRVQAVTISQPWLWRFPDWYRVTISQAGVGPSLEDSNKETNILLPVGDRDAMLRALWLIFPNLGCPDPVEKLIAGINGYTTDGGFLANPRRARIFSPLGWKRDAIFITDQVAMIRRGRIRRGLVVCALPRVQSHRVTRGPIQKRMWLADLQLHMASGSPVESYLSNMDASLAGELVEQLMVRCRQAQVREREDVWFERATAALEASGRELFEDGPEVGQAPPSALTPQSAAAGAPGASARLSGPAPQPNPVSQPAPQAAPTPQPDPAALADPAAPADPAPNSPEQPHE